MASTGGGSAYATDILAIQVGDACQRLARLKKNYRDQYRLFLFDRICITSKILVPLDPSSY
jgi:hypothetical protein